MPSQKRLLISSGVFSSYPFASMPSARNARIADGAMHCVLWGMAILASTIIGVVIVVIVAEAWPSLVGIGWKRFLSDQSWHPTSNEYNLVPIIAGTFLVAGGGLVLASALGLLSAIFCTFYAPPFIASSYLRLVELLAGVPSVVLG